MGFLKKILQRFFARTDALQDEASERWNLNANRRTILILLLLGSISAYLYIECFQAPDEFPADRLISVPAGKSLNEISESLVQQGVVRSPLTFRALVTLYGRERGAHAGDYLFKEPKNVWEVAKAISIGAYGLEPMKIRIPEGFTAKEMAIVYGPRLQRFNANTFFRKAQPQEGFLYPDTYFFLPNANEDTVISAMRQNFETHIEPYASKIASSTHTVAEIVTMASIIEREARNPADRRMISGVLWNRLKKKMPLQVDVTFIYTIGKGTFQLTMKDLTTDSPYNTYIHKGLPPGPIGSPSLDSIEAAISPTKNDYLFYLADNNGVTHFSKTYEEHRQKKLLYLGT